MKNKHVILCHAYKCLGRESSDQVKKLQKLQELERKSLTNKEIHPLEGKCFLKLIISGEGGRDIIKMSWAKKIPEVNKRGVGTILSDLRVSSLFNQNFLRRITGDGFFF